AARAGIFMIDASKGFMKDGNKNRLRHQDIHRIVDVFNRQIEVPKYSRMVPLAEISDVKNDYNLNLPRYIDSTEAEDLQDIAAHLRGVTVRVVGDDDAAANEYHAGYQALTTAGILIVTDTDPGKIQHNKFMIFDGQAVWTGSTNFTDTCLTLNANNSLVVTDTTLANIYTTEFDEMWGGTFHSAKSDNTSHLLNYNGTLVKSFFSPTDLVAFEVWNRLYRK
ncbi:MAG: N-6 DNA methylase, partial [Chloroflexi bacterium]|nr:N-6 DNA methylase [Chloroflexota bacterium]